MLKSAALLTLLFLSPAQSKEALKAHVHGTVELNVAVKEDGKELNINLDSPAEAFLGFERAIKSKEDKAKWKEIETLWQKDLLKLVSVDGVKCQLASASLKLEADEHHEEGHDHGKGKHVEKTESHGDLEGEAKLVCDSSVAGKDLLVTLKQKFPRIKNLMIAVIPSKGEPRMKKSDAPVERVKL